MPICSEIYWYEKDLIKEWNYRAAIVGTGKKKKKRKKKATL